MSNTNNRRHFYRVPSDKLTWYQKAFEAGVVNKSLRQWKDLRSGSKVTQPQYLLFRTIFPSCGINEFDPDVFGLTEKVKTAEEILDHSEDFCSYIAAIEENHFFAQGQFAPLREQQSEILAKPILEPEMTQGPTTTDEAPVNSTLINFLKALLSVVDNHEYVWRYSRCHFKATWAENDAQNQSTQSNRPAIGIGNDRVKVEEHGFTAINDGQMQHAVSFLVKLIVECKRGPRLQRSPVVEMQETAQLVAWIRQYPSSARQRVIISQNGPNIYVSFARYTDKYLKYLNDGDVSSNEFMSVYQFGPYNINHAEQMKKSSIILVALFL